MLESQFSKWCFLKTLMLVKIVTFCQGHSSMKREVYVQTNEFSINSKTICVNGLGLNNERIACPFSNRIEIINSGLYNASSRINLTNFECFPVDQTTPLIKTVTNILKMECSQYTCFISIETIKRLLGDPTVTNLNDIILDINYSCRFSSSDGPSSGQRAYSFTYFFYIITLVLSTSCILLGGVFILRKFLVMRRRNNLIANRSRQNQGYVPNIQTEQGVNNGGFENNPRVWTTAYPPPSYDNIYESSLPINPLPDYNSSLNNLVKKKDQQKTDRTDTEEVPLSNIESNSVVFSNPDQMVTINNPNFNMNNVNVDIIGADNVTNSTTLINENDLNTVGKKGKINGENQNEIV